MLILSDAKKAEFFGDYFQLLLILRNPNKRIDNVNYFLQFQAGKVAVIRNRILKALKTLVNRLLTNYKTYGRKLFNFVHKVSGLKPM